MLLESITLDCLPYLSERTTPTWYVLLVLTELLGYSIIPVVLVSSPITSKLNIVPDATPVWSSLNVRRGAI